MYLKQKKVMLNLSSPSWKEKENRTLEGKNAIGSLDHMTKKLVNMEIIKKNYLSLSLSHLIIFNGLYFSKINQCTYHT